MQLRGGDDLRQRLAEQDAGGSSHRDEHSRSPALGMATRTVHLAPGSANRLYYQDLWSFRELLGVLAWRDIAVRYKQAVLGLAWAVLRPLLTIIVFTIVFNRIAKLPGEGGVPYEILVYCGMMAWFLFSSIISDASLSLVNNANLIGKIYFPRLLIPLSAAAVGLIDFCINLLLFLPFMWFYDYVPSWRIIFLPIFVFWAIIAALGPALLMAALNVKYRDFRQIVPFAVQFGLYVSPVGYVSSLLPEKWRLLYSLNPMVGVIDGFRWSILGNAVELYLPTMAISGLVSLFFLWLGLRYFRQTERGFADIL